jgi:uncharacterized membrane protein YeaQ/YmgE (transglycosylase-associated protein family)
MENEVSRITTEALLTWAVVGAIIGWLASQIMTEGSQGIQTDVIVGAVAGLAGGLLFTQIVGFNLGRGQVPLLANIVNGSLGAVIGTFAWRVFAPAPPAAGKQEPPKK